MRAVRLLGRGHGAIRATHAKTLEFSADPEITERATCIVAVGVDGAGAGRLAGPVRITLAAGGESFTFEAIANPAWTPGGAAVVRRSAVRRPGTLATEATAAAADLPRALVAALRDPAAEVTVTVEPIRGRPAVVLVALDPAPADRAALAAEVAAADLVVAEDEQAALLLGERVARGPVEVGGRVLVAAVRELPGATVVDALHRVRVETLGLPAPLAAAAASPSRAPVVLAPEGADARTLLRRLPAATRLVVRVPADQVTTLLAAAVEIRGTGSGVVVAADEPPRRVDAASEVRGHDPVQLCIDATTESGALDPAVRAAVDGLLADGAPTKTVAHALATLTGWDRRRAYDAVLGWPRP